MKQKELKTKAKPAREFHPMEKVVSIAEVKAQIAITKVQCEIIINRVKNNNNEYSEEAIRLMTSMIAGIELLEEKFE